MKKTLSFILVVLLCVKANAQLSKGTIQLGGSLSLNSYSSDNEAIDFNTTSFKSSTYDASPKCGIFISKRSVIGLAASLYKYGYESTGSLQASEYSYNYSRFTFSIGPYYRHYFPITEKANVFAQGIASVSTGKANDRGYNTNGERTENNFRNHGFGFQISPGFNYFINPKWGLEVSFGSIYYNASVDKPAATNTSKNYHNYDSMGLNLSLSSLSFGVNYFISK